MSTVSISIRPNGTIETIFDPSAAELYASLGTVTTRRVSHVEPCGTWRRFVFRCVRSRVADSSRLAGLCRRIPGKWAANMSDGAILGPFPTRKAAIAAEIAVLRGLGL